MEDYSVDVAKIEARGTGWGRIRPEYLLQVPKGVEHSFSKISKEPVKAIVIHFG
ncbi:MAG: hypothetical protein JW852_03465 [Spirochaetales bacterium]|nr:hypothetical protein [Spirochaetales bacterium]